MTHRRARRPRPVADDGDDSPDEQIPFSLMPSPVTDDRSTLIVSLGWSRAEAVDTRARLRPFAEEWNEPAMAAYDEL